MECLHIYIYIRDKYRTVTKIRTVTSDHDVGM